jgi:argininosuccinate lyase
MPQKKNPDPMELVRAKSAVVTGNLVGMLAIVKGLASGYSRDLQDIKPQLFESSMICLATLKIVNGVVRTLQVNSGRMATASSTSYAIALDVAEQLVTQHRIPFRDAHRIVGKLVDKAAARQITLAELDDREVQRVLSGLEAHLDSKTVTHIVKDMTPAKSLRLRRSAGSPKKEEQEAMIDSLSQGVKNYKQGIQKRVKMIEGALKNLSQEVTKYKGS